MLARIWDSAGREVFGADELGAKEGNKAGKDEEGSATDDASADEASDGMEEQNEEAAGD